MLKQIDKRLGRELGLSGKYADCPAFQIVNDTHDLLLAFTSRLIGLKYSEYGDEFARDPQWSIISDQTVAFNRRFRELNDDAVEAAALAEEILAFTTTVIDPLVYENSL